MISEHKSPSSFSKGGVTRSLGPELSAQSMSTTSCGSAGSRSDTMKAALANENVRLSNLDIHGDDAGSQGPILNKKKKRGQRAVGGENRGLRQFSVKVCEKVKSKGRTTYNEVADELVAEFATPSSNFGSPDQHQDDEKNIRRRVYDALNVLMAIGIISKDKKEIQWNGLPRTTLNDIEEAKAELAGLKKRIEKKASYLQELEEQYVGLHNLIQRNEQLYGSGNAPTGGVALPFILVQTRPHATVEVEISEDMQLVYFDFNSTPFELHDDNYVLKAMGFCERQQGEVGTHDCITNGSQCTTNQGESSSRLDVRQPYTPLPLRSNAAGSASTSPSLPGILKAHVKHEH